MKTILSILSLLSLVVSCNGQNRIEKKNTKASGEKQSIYQFKVQDIAGKTFDLASLKGKKLMIVNTASKCGYTKQYADLQKLYEKYKDTGFTIVGFPANNFMKQEPGTNDEIASFCKKNYGVSFPMMAKISVKGKDQHPVYKFLTQENQNAFADSKVKWNFQKYLIDENGYVCGVVNPKTNPMDEGIMKWIEGEE